MVTVKNNAATVRGFPTSTKVDHTTPPVFIKPGDSIKFREEDWNRFKGNPTVALAIESGELIVTEDEADESKRAFGRK